jgi:hypothetical protein
MQLQRRFWLALSTLPVAVGLLAAAAGGARAQVSLYPDEVERLDVISIEQDGRNL